MASSLKGRHPRLASLCRRSLYMRSAKSFSLAIAAAEAPESMPFLLLPNGSFYDDSNLCRNAIERACGTLRKTIWLEKVASALPPRKYARPCTANHWPPKNVSASGNRTGGWRTSVGCGFVHRTGAFRPACSVPPRKPRLDAVQYCNCLAKAKLKSFQQHRCFDRTKNRISQNGRNEILPFPVTPILISSLGDRYPR